MHGSLWSGTCAGKVVLSTETAKAGDFFEVIDGVKEGERVVTSANFLIDSESKLKKAGGDMGGMPGMGH